MTRKSSSMDRRRAVRARSAEPRLRLIMLFTVSAGHLWPWILLSAFRLKRWYMSRR